MQNSLKVSSIVSKNGLFIAKAGSEIGSTDFYYELLSVSALNLKKPIKFEGLLFYKIGGIQQRAVCI